MLAQMTSQQLSEWETMFDRWHIGEAPDERADLRAAMIQAVIANVHRGKGRSYKPDDFLPKFTSGQMEAPDVYTALGRIAKRTTRARASQTRTKGEANVGAE